MERKINLVFAAGPQYEQLVAFIEDEDGYLFGIISQEEGPGKFKIQIPVGLTFPLEVPDKEIPMLDLKEFEDAIQKAKQRLTYQTPEEE